MNVRYCTKWPNGDECQHGPYWQTETQPVWEDFYGPVLEWKQQWTVEPIEVMQVSHR